MVGGRMAHISFFVVFSSVLRQFLLKAGEGRWTKEVDPFHFNLDTRMSGSWVLSAFEGQYGG
jgi:hypothetical protein